MTFGAVLSFGLAHYGSSEFELMAEELLMSDSVVKVSRTIRPLSLGTAVFFHLDSGTFTSYLLPLLTCWVQTKNFQYRVYYSKIISYKLNLKVISLVFICMG